LEEWVGAPVQAKIALAALGVSLAVSVLTDFRERRILNAVTYPALLLVTACVLWLGGLALFLEAAFGALVCAGPLALAMWRGWMGAGDVKLMALVGLVAGATGGWAFSLTVLVVVAIAGGVQALLWIGAAKLRRRAPPRSIPYALAIAAGTTWAFLSGIALF
jgi:Flp pilus assembly protein protease CpaA